MGNAEYRLGKYRSDHECRNPKMDIPNKLEFTWYSLVEKKFYTGKWALDKEKIEKLFKEGFTDTTGKKKPILHSK
jgi:hypothetical protein